MCSGVAHSRVQPANARMPPALPQMVQKAPTQAGAMMATALALALANANPTLTQAAVEPPAVVSGIASRCGELFQHTRMKGLHPSLSDRRAPATAVVATIFRCSSMAPT